MKRLIAIMAPALLLADGATAQDMSVPSVTVANPGGYANPLQLDTDRYKREQRKAGARARPSAARCSLDSMPAAERRQMESEYHARRKADGEASANLWIKQRGAQFRARLEREGVCPPANGRAATPAASSPPPAALRNLKGGKCTKTVMQARNIANPGGGAMSMIMVPVCVN